MTRAKASEEIKLDLQRTIMSGKYPPGSRIPSERELAAKYNISRIPVREAIDALVKQGILKTEPHVGTFVTDLVNVEVLEKDVYHPPRIDRKILSETLKTRCLIESEGARLAALAATNTEIENIQRNLFATIDEFRKLRQRMPNAFLQADYEFHHSVVLASHSDLLIQYMAINRETITMHQFLSLQNDCSMNSVPDAHLKVYNAILGHQADEARQEMYDHLNRTGELILASIKKGQY